MRALAPCLTLAWPGLAGALAPPHDHTHDIGCLDCHALHGGFGMLPRGPAQEAMCRVCHNPTGQAAALSDVANHVVGDRVIDCGSCHDPHGPHSTDDPRTGARALNLSLVRHDPAAHLRAPAFDPDGCISRFTAVGAAWTWTWTWTEAAGTSG